MGITLPADLNKWNFKTISYLVDKGLFETEDFDFKADLSQGLVKTACAFANSKGGFLIFGVKDNRQLPTEMRIRGIPPKRDFPKEFGDKLSGKTTPPVKYNFKNPPVKIPKSQNVVHVIHIPRGDLPHQSDDSVFWHRTNKGNEKMTWHQIRQAFLQEQKILIKKSAQFRYALQERLIDIMDNLLIRLCPYYDRNPYPWSTSTRDEFVKFFNDFMEKDEDKLFSILVKLPFVNFVKIHGEYRHWVTEIERLDRFPHSDLLPDEQDAFVNLKEEISMFNYNFDVYEFLEEDIQQQGGSVDVNMSYESALRISKQRKLRENNLLVTIRFMKGLCNSIEQMLEKIETMKEEYGELALKSYLD